MSDIIRKRISFYGSVQGVGFRFRAKHAAAAAGAPGWVRNEYAGSVSMEIQGTEAQILKVISEIEQGTFVHIYDMDVRQIPVIRDERGFSSAYY